VIEGKSEITQIALNKLAYSAVCKLFHAYLYSSYLRLFDAHTGASSTPRRKEARQMPSPRWLTRLSIPMMVGAALVTNTAVAVAVADAADDTFLGKMQHSRFYLADERRLRHRRHGPPNLRRSHGWKNAGRDCLRHSLHLGRERHYVRRRHIHGECRRIDLLPGLVRKFRPIT